MTGFSEPLRPIAAVSRLPFVEQHEESVAKKVIDDEFIRLTGSPFNFRPAGYMVACKIYVRDAEWKQIDTPEGKKSIWLPQQALMEDKYQSVAALVCAVGPQAYKGENKDGTLRYPEGAWVTPATWCVIPRYESFMFSYKGVAMALLPDDKIMGIIEDPKDVEAAHLADKI